MKYTHGIGQSDGVDDAVGANVPRLQSVLHAVQLVAGLPLRVIRELPQSTQGVTEEPAWLTSIDYIRIDIMASAKAGFRIGPVPCAPL